MIVLEPSPGPPRRGATRPDSSDAPGAIGPSAFDMELTEGEAKDRAEPAGTAVALAAAAILAQQTPMPAGSATPAAPAPTAAAPVPGQPSGQHPSQHPAPASPPAPGIDATAASRDAPPAAAAPVPEGDGPDGQSAPVSLERPATAPASLALPADARRPDPAAAAPAGITDPPRRADAPSLGRAAPATGAGEPALGLAAPAAQPDAAGPAPHLAPPEALSASALSASALAAPGEAAAPRPAASAAPAVADPRAVCGQVAVAVATSDDSRIEIRLDPPELGRVHIHLTTSDGGVQALVAAQRPETQDFLRRHADTLAQELVAAGYGDVSLAFGSGDDAPPGGDERPPSDWHAVGLAAAEGPATAPAPRVGARGALDIRL